MTYQHKPYKSGVFRGHIAYKWVDVELSDWNEDIRVLDIETSTNTENGRFIGYWVSSKDVVSYHALEAPSFEYEHHGESGEFYVDQQIWEFGDKPRLRVYRPTAKSKNTRFSFSILARPILPYLEPFKLNICGYANPGKSATTDKVFEQEYEFKKGNSQQVGDKLSTQEQMRIMNCEFNRFKENAADNLTGFGNIVHPKQFFTIRGLERVLDVYLVESPKKLKLGYIGTDTTENLRSIVRWLLSTGKADRIGALTVFYTTKWDRNFLKRLNLEKEYAQCCPELRIRFLELSEETISIQAKKENLDVMIATYVAPWAVDESRKSYKNLLNATMGSTSYLVSIDPKNENSSVRSELTAHTKTHDLYDDLGMYTAQSPIDYENNSIEWSVWKKKPHIKE